MKKTGIWLLLALLLAGGLYLGRHKVKRDLHNWMVQGFSVAANGGCTYTAACGDLLYYDCGAAEGKPSYYVDDVRKVTLARCGSTCQGDMVRCKKDCPPAAWTCDFYPFPGLDYFRLKKLNAGLAKEPLARGTTEAPYPFAGK